jgi:decaprenylphospho-beta-D-erythro-pentofuranosid-2-ulose 2-reductase
MTAGMDRAPFSTTPEAVAEAVVRGLESGKEVVHVPPVLRWVFSGLRHVPRPVFRKLPDR